MSKKASKTPMQKWTGTNSRIQQLEAQVKDLESQLYKAQLMATGTGPGVQAIIDEADRQRQIMQAKIEEMQEIIKLTDSQVSLIGNDICVKSLFEN